MANRPIFIPINEFPYVKEENLEFQWFPGFSKTQAQKSIRSLHQAAKKIGINPVLEISSKSSKSTGVKLSAFNITLLVKENIRTTVECAFQGSKVFAHGGPYHDLYYKSSREAKKNERIRKSGNVIKFNLAGKEFPINPPTAFYDWIYIQALLQNPHLTEKIINYSGFSDIAFNPKKSINCQAKSAALFIAFSKLNLLEEKITDFNQYYSIIINKNKTENDHINNGQLNLPFE